jgi:peptidoglycan hydrolase-like protein with peptidoglycan-binding domain
MKKILIIIVAILFLAPNAEAMMYQHPYNPPISDQYVIRMGYGSYGPSVMYLQQLLQELGYFPTYLPATGYYGTMTVRAVQSFQRAHGLPVTGYIGALTQSVLNQYAMSTPYETYQNPMPYAHQQVYEDSYMMESPYQCRSLPCQVVY